MSNHLPVIIFLLPFLAAICMPLVGGKNRHWCRPLALVAVLAMCAAAIINVWCVLDHGGTRYAFGGWPISTAFPDLPLGIEWVNDELASVMLAVLLPSMAAIVSSILPKNVLIGPKRLGPSNLKEVLSTVR